MHITQESDYAIRIIYCLAKNQKRMDARSISQERTACGATDSGQRMSAAFFCATIGFPPRCVPEPSDVAPAMRLPPAARRR